MQEAGGSLSAMGPSQADNLQAQLRRQEAGGVQFQGHLPDQGPFSGQGVMGGVLWLLKARLLQSDQHWACKVEMVKLGWAMRRTM